MKRHYNIYSYNRTSHHSSVSARRTKHISLSCPRRQSSHMFPLRLMVFFACLLSPALGKWFKKDEQCKEINPPKDFDIDRYIEKTWYVQKQQPISYLPREDFFCVIATYEQEGKRQWLRKAITVRNYANTGLNNPNGAGNGRLCATQFRTDKNPAKLNVSPCFLPARLGGPYWVVAFADDYSWAIVTGGQPDRRGECGGSKLCTTASGGRFTLLGNDQGLWFFTRAQVADEATLMEMEMKALELGICTAAMEPVVQEGCLYEGAVIKS